MTEQTLDKAILEAERFLRSTEHLKHKIHNDISWYYGCKETGAVKRASLDLTRALADLRRRQL